MDGLYYTIEVREMLYAGYTCSLICTVGRGFRISEFLSRAVPCGKNWQLPQKTPGPSVRFALGAVITPGLMGGESESATSAYRTAGTYDEDG